jgi:hypothetical protein
MKNLQQQSHTDGFETNSIIVPRFPHPCAYVCLSDFVISSSFPVSYYLGYVETGAWREEGGGGGGCAL